MPKALMMLLALLALALNCAHAAESTALKLFTATFTVGPKWHAAHASHPAFAPTDRQRPARPNRANPKPVFT